MADSYTVLFGKYERALLFIREIEQERDEFRKQLEDIRDSNAQFEKNTKRLCETIMKKERGGNDEKTWFKMSPLEMVLKAEESLNKYYQFTSDTYAKLLKHNNERTEKIANLETELNKEKDDHKKDVDEITQEKDAVIKDLIQKLKTGKADDEDIGKILQKSSPKRTKLDMSLSESVQISTEKDDDIKKEVKDATKAMYESGELVVRAEPGPAVNTDESIKDTVKESIKEISKKQAENVKERIKTMSDSEKLLIRIMGETGLSEMKPLLTTAKEKYPDELPTISRLKVVMHDLFTESENSPTQKEVIAVKCPVPGSANFVLYKLSEFGKDIYSYLFGKDPVEPEMDMIIRNHTSLEHGYGIKKVAELFEKMQYLTEKNADIAYLTRLKEYTLKTGERTGYIPDIVISYKKGDDKKTTAYIEYETGKCNDTDFIAKCNKMASLLNNMYFVVPNNDAKQVTLEKIKKWKELVTAPGKEFPNERGVVTIRLSTYFDLRDNDSKNQIPWGMTIKVKKKQDKEGGVS